MPKYNLQFKDWKTSSMLSNKLLKRDNFKRGSTKKLPLSKALESITLVGLTYRVVDASMVG